MAGDNLLVCSINTKELTRTLRNITMACAMETITAHTIILIQFIRNSIEICVLRHCLMERCIKHTNLRQVRHQLRNGLHSLKICRIVKRSKVTALLKYLQNLIVKNNTLVELLTAVHHAMTDSIDLAKVFDYTNFRIGKQREDELHTFCVLWDVVHHLLLLAIGKLYLHKGAIKTYTLGAT